MIIFLDIDGVLNPFGFQRTSDFDDATLHTIDSRLGSYELLLSPTLGARLSGLDAEILWTTTWEQEAYKIGDIVGIEADYLSLGLDWKYGAVRRTIRERREPFIWIDDDAIDGTQQRNIEAEFPDIPGLFVRTEPNTGLTWNELATIEAFIEEHRS